MELFSDGAQDNSSSGNKDNSKVRNEGRNYSKPAEPSINTVERTAYLTSIKKGKMTEKKTCGSFLATQMSKISRGIFKVFISQLIPFPSRSKENPRLKVFAGKINQDDPM